MSIYDIIAQGGRVANIPQAIGSGIKLADMFRQNRIGNATEQDVIEAVRLKNLQDKYNLENPQGADGGAQFGASNGVLYNNRTGEYVVLPKQDKQYAPQSPYSIEGGYKINKMTGEAQKLEDTNPNEGGFTIGNTRFDKYGNKVVSVDTPKKPMPASIVKLQQENLNDMSVASGIKKDMSSFVEQIDKGDLDLGFMSNIANKARNKIGISSDESSNLATFEASLNKLRNDSLRLNKGTQTEGDAVRAWDELISNINDPKVVRDRLNEIQQINDRAMTLKQVQTDQLREQYDAEPIDYSKYTNVAPVVDVDKTAFLNSAPNIPKSHLEYLKANAHIQKVVDDFNAKYGNGQDIARQLLLGK